MPKDWSSGLSEASRVILLKWPWPMVFHTWPLKWKECLFYTCSCSSNCCNYLQTICTAKALACPPGNHMLSPAALQLFFSQDFAHLSFTMSKGDRSTKPQQHILQFTAWKQICIYLSRFPTTPEDKLANQFVSVTINYIFKVWDSTELTKLWLWVVQKMLWQLILKGLTPSADPPINLEKPSIWASSKYCWPVFFQWKHLQRAVEVHWYGIQCGRKNIKKLKKLQHLCNLFKIFCFCSLVCFYFLVRGKKSDAVMIKKKEGEGRRHRRTTTY